MKKTKMTIEKLAGMTQRGLRDVEVRLTEKMDTMDKKIENMGTTMNAVLRVVENIEGRMGEMHTAARVDIPDLRERVENLEASR